MIKGIEGKPSSYASSLSSSDLREAIRRRAEAIYESSGRIPGRDLENWVQAEREILRQVNGGTSSRTGLVIQVDGIQYLGEYTLKSANGYTPGEFAPGDPVSIRFDEKKMYIRRQNGSELETTVIRKIVFSDR
jgi:hypothetical protein